MSISDDELLSIKRRLQTKTVDDSQGILWWFERNGVNLIDEVLEARKLKNILYQPVFRR